MTDKNAQALEALKHALVHYEAGNRVVEIGNAIREAIAALESSAPSAAEPVESVDAQDAKRWRFIARHWHSVHVSFNKKPNTLKLMRLTMRTDYTKPRESAEAIEREIDAVIAAKGLE